MDLNGLAELKSRLMTDPDFERVTHEFVSRFCEHVGFFDHGYRTREPLLEKMIETAAAEVLGRKVRLQQVCLIVIPEQNFIHGGLVVGDHLCQVLYFSDVLRGLLALAEPMGSNVVRFVRFSGTIVCASPDPDTPSRN